MNLEREQIVRLKGKLPVVRVVLACVGVLVMLGVYGATPAEVAARVVRSSGYWFILAAFAGLVVYGWGLFAAYGQRALGQLRGLSVSFAVFFIVCLGVLFAHADLGPKVLMDDAILAGTAKSLHQTREVNTPTYGRWVQNGFTTFEGYVDKRPLLYPFALSVLHDCTGFRESNAYVLNLLCGVVLLGGVSLLGYLISGAKGAYLMALLWLSIPLYAQNATGGGMDLINLLLIVTVILLSVLYWKRLDALSEGALSLAGVLLAQGRYESPLFLVPIAVVIMIGWYRGGRVLLSAGTICAAPLLIGLLLQNKFFAQTEALWELHSGAAHPFSLHNIGENFPRALEFYFNGGDAYANSVWVALLGFPALIFFTWYFFRQWRESYSERPVHVLVGIFGLFLFAHAIVILCYHDGKLDRLFASRFALPFYLLLTTSIVIVLSRITKKEVVWWGLSVCTAVFIAGFTQPMNAKAVFTQRNYVANEIEWLHGLADREFEPRSLVVDIYTIPWTLRATAALSPLQAYGNALRIDADLKSGKFPAMYLVERQEFTIEGESPQLVPSIYPAGVFVVESIARRSFQPFTLTQVYRVVGVDREAAEKLLGLP